MVFSDQAFLFFFLPICLALGLLLRSSRHFTTFLFFASLSFYFWSAGYQVWLLVFSAIFNYFAGLAVAKKRTKQWLGLFISVNIALLIYYKYSFFVATNIGLDPNLAITNWLKKITLPIGISFFTFQAISYLVDVYRKHVEPETNFYIFGAYLSFFPQLIAGPVVRFADVTKDFHKPKSYHQSFPAGVRRFSHGLLKKLLIADSVALIANAAFLVPNSEVTFAVAAIGALAYTLQIYFDFSGYSDMAIGLGLMFGIKFNENFRHPYSASSITDFWRRWHISLSSWFRDYVYIPLGGNRGGGIRTYVKLLIVFVVTGFWHGAAWTFLLWGLYHGAFLIIERIVWGRDASVKNSFVLRLFYCLPVAIVGWIIFRAENMGQMVSFLTALASPFTDNAFVLPATVISAASPIPLFVMFLASTIFLTQRNTTFGQIVEKDPENIYQGVGQILYVGAVLSIATTLSLSLNYSPFLYFRF